MQSTWKPLTLTPLSGILSCWTSLYLRGKPCVGPPPRNDPLETSQGCSTADPQPCEALWDLPAGIAALLKGTKLQVENSCLFPMAAQLCRRRLRALPALQASGIEPSHLTNPWA